MINKNNTKIKSKETVPLKNICGAEKLLDHIYLTFSHEIKVLMTAYFKNIDKILSQIAEKSDNRKKKKLYFDSLKSIRVYKLNVLSSFLKTLKQTFILFKNNNFVYFEDKVTKAVKKSNSVTDSFDKNDVMEKLAQNALIHESEDVYQEHLCAFKKRLSQLIALTLEPYHLPIGPYVLVSSFAKSIRLLHLDLNVKLILYKHFERGVMTQLDGLYTEINQYLNNNGVVTGLENHVINKQLNNQKAENTNNSLSSHDIKDSIVNMLIILQWRLLQDLSENSQGINSPEEIKNSLLLEIEKSQQYLEQQDRDTINLVTMLFQLIIGNRNIPDPIKISLTKLQIPFLKAAIQDDSLLANKQHPAQILLDLISHSSIGWSVELDTNNRFINKINETVDTILDENHLNEVFFNTQLNNYQNFITQHKNNFEIEQKRVQGKSMGRGKIITAMKTVEALLAHKMDDNPMPMLIKNMLLGPWKNLLALLLVRHSNTSEKYLRMVQFIDDLIAILKSKQYEIVVQKNIGKLCIEYEEGLKLVAYNGEELHNKREELYQCLLKLHKLDDKRKNINFFLESSQSTSVNTQDQSDTSKNQASSDKNSQISTQGLKDLNQKDKKLVAAIKTGMWLAFSDDDEPFQAKLSWISPRSGKFLFVNSKGLKTIDKTPQQLATGLKDKSIKIVKKPRIKE
ncbi:MAG: DUF1631 family protein [Alcanivoracaceae bacterium]|nr:DUF1631 family protein [Alcanivoracaceae bacterium]